MSNNVFKSYNQVLIKEKFYELKYNPSKKTKIKQKLMSLLYTLEKNYNNYDYSHLNGEDSISTIEAMNNPYMKKFSDDIYTKYEQKKLIKNLLPKKSETNKNQNNVNTFNKTKTNKISISEYADFLKIYDYKNSNNFSLSPKNKTNFFSEKINSIEKTMKSKVKNILPKKCYFCNIIAERNKKEKYNLKTERNLSGYKKYIKILQNFTDRKNEDNNLTRRKTITENIKLVDMKSELTKNKSIVKYKEINRIEFDPTNLFLITKPLIPSIRAKISKNMKKRPFKPVRNVIPCKRYSNICD